MHKGTKKQRNKGIEKIIYLRKLTKMQSIKIIYLHEGTKHKNRELIFNKSQTLKLYDFKTFDLYVPQFLIFSRAVIRFRLTLDVKFPVARIVAHTSIVAPVSVVAVHIIVN